MTKETELIERWGIFLLKIENRFNELIHQAKEASTPIIEKLEYDASVISNAWNGISAQVRQLQKKNG